MTLVYQKYYNFVIIDEITLRIVRLYFPIVLFYDIIYVENKKISDIIVTTEQFNYFLSADEKMLNSTKRNINEFKKWFEGTLKKEIKKYNNIKIDNEIFNSIYIEIFNRIGWNYGRKRKI